MPTPPKTAAAAARKLQFKTWDQYVAEAAHPPFELVVSADETLLFPCPDGAATRNIEIARRTGEFDLMVNATFGEHVDRVLELTAGAPGGVMRELVMDVLEHFELVVRPKTEEDGDEPGEGSASSS